MMFGIHKSRKGFHVCSPGFLTLGIVYQPKQINPVRGFILSGEYEWNNISRFPGNMIGIKT
jgi:hypothetical protein